MKPRLIALAVALVLGLVGTAVLLRYVQGADARALAGTQTVDVLMVQAPIPVGTPAEGLADLITVRPVPALAAVPGRITDVSELTGQLSVVPLMAGEQLLPSQFALAAGAADGAGPVVPDGFQQFTVLLQSQRALGGAIAAGDRVGMFLSFPPPLAVEYATHLRLSSVLVTSVRTTSTGTPADKTATSSPPSDAASAASVAGAAAAPPASAGVDLYVTFATDAADAEVVIFAAEFGTIWLSNEPVG
ncbi:MAG: RcpC/CpaB family pilus assembly protein, partial [Nakamurella sp.]